MKEQLEDVKTIHQLIRMVNANGGQGVLIVDGIDYEIVNVGPRRK